jgi:ATP-dependent Clp protease adaptor protein ClpS
MLHNDDVTPMDFVVDTLLRFFISERNLAMEIMLRAHNDGMAFVAVMPLEYAETKVQAAHSRARAHGFPLTFSIESAD